MDRLLKSVTFDEIDALYRFLQMYHKLECFMSSEKKITDPNDPIVLETMGRFGSILIYGCVNLRQLFNRIYSMLPSPEDISQTQINQIIRRGGKQLLDEEFE